VKTEELCDEEEKENDGVEIMKKLNRNKDVAGNAEKGARIDARRRGKKYGKGWKKSTNKVQKKSTNKRSPKIDLIGKKTKKSQPLRTVEPKRNSETLRSEESTARGDDNSTKHQAVLTSFSLNAHKMKKCPAREELEGKKLEDRKREREYRLCSVDGCYAFKQGKPVQTADKFGPPGVRCCKHGGGSKCSVKGCDAYNIGPVLLPDRFGHPGLRCRRHLGGKRCTVKACISVAVAPVSCEDNFGPAGLRCYRHGGRNKKLAKQLSGLR